MTDNLSDFSVCIPTLNPGRWVDRLAAGLAAQTSRPRRILVIDSSSTDGSLARLTEIGAEIITISRTDFDHAGTRNRFLDELDEPVLVYLTQDAIPSRADALGILVSKLQEAENIGIAFGRQIARPQASTATRVHREFLYPLTSSRHSLDDKSRLGVRASFASNAFSAYRREALESIGRFAAPSICSEDRAAAGRMIEAGWHVAYVATAQVEHSHEYTLAQQFRRYFDLGVFEADNPWFDAAYGRPSSEGLRMVRRQLKAVRHEGTARESAHVLAAGGVGFIAHRLGRAHRRLPPDLRQKVSMNPCYFTDRSAR